MTAQAVEMLTHDGLILRGQHWQGGSDWVIMLHDLDADLDSWLPLIAPLRQRGYTLLTLDLRGHGASDGEWDASKASLDVQTALAYARQHDANKVFMAAAGISCLTVLRLADESKPKALALLSPSPVAAEQIKDLRGAGMSKLFFVGAQRGEFARTAQALQQQSIGWAFLVSFPTQEQSAALLHSQWRAHVVENIAAFFEYQRHFDEFGNMSGTLSPDEALLKRLLGHSYR